MKQMFAYIQSQCKAYFVPFKNNQLERKKKEATGGIKQSLVSDEFIKKLNGQPGLSKWSMNNTPMSKVILPVITIPFLLFSWLTLFDSSFSNMRVCCLSLLDIIFSMKFLWKFLVYNKTRRLHHGPLELVLAILLNLSGI